MLDCGPYDHESYEYASVEAFVEYLVEDEGDETFNHHHLACLNARLGRPVGDIRKDLEDYGLKLARRPKQRRIRTFQDNPHDRWYGPGSSPTHGGSGWEQITGFNTRNG